MSSFQIRFQLKYEKVSFIFAYVVGSPIFIVWGLMCLGFDLSGVVNGTSPASKTVQFLQFIVNLLMKLVMLFKGLPSFQEPLASEHLKPENIKKNFVGKIIEKVCGTKILNYLLA